MTAHPSKRASESLWRDPREANDDSAKSYDEAIRALREKHIRNHAIAPRPGNAEEMRWWNEGPEPKRGPE